MSGGYQIPLPKSKHLFNPEKLSIFFMHVAAYLRQPRADEVGFFVFGSLGFRVVDFTERYLSDPEILAWLGSFGVLLITVRYKRVLLITLEMRTGLKC